MLYLKVPGPEDEQRVMDYRAEFLKEGDKMVNGSGGLGRFERYGDWLSQVLDNRREETVRQGLVPASTLLCVREEDDRLVGIIDIRHRLNEHLARFGGHIGYSIRLSERRKGCGREMLRLALTRVCPALGLTRALVTCDKDNEASRRTIMACGGSIESEIEEDGGVTQRYWLKVHPFSVRAAEPGDGEAISVLTHRALGYEVIRDDTRARVARLISKPQNRIWVAQYQGEVCGYLHATDYETCYRAPQKNVVSLAVDPARQGMGMGRALLREAEAWARWEKCDGVRLVSGVVRTGAHAFYLACGYHLRKEYKNFEKLF